MFPSYESDRAKEPLMQAKLLPAELLIAKLSFMKFRCDLNQQNKFENTTGILNTEAKSSNKKLSVKTHET